MASLRVNLGFAQASDHDLETLAGNVVDGMTGNAVYPVPPISMAVMAQTIVDFTDAIAAQAQGGTAATAFKNMRREDLVRLLRMDAAYVQELATNLADLLSSGFEAVSNNHAQTQLGKPSITRIDNGMSTQLILIITAILNARVYEVRFSADGGATWQSAGLYASTRRGRVERLQRLERSGESSEHVNE